MDDDLTLLHEKVPVWSDEFDGPAGAPPDPANWRHETGGHGWGNQELQCYTDETANACLTGNGSLAITAHRLAPDRRSRYEGCSYTSARLVTKDLRHFSYGTVEARVTLPAGGLWPAFWMLGEDIDEVGWPACGEIDIMENFGDDPAVVRGTVHGPGYADPGVSTSYRAADSLARHPHVYSVSWGPGEVRWSLDEVPYAALTPEDLSPKPWVFDRPFYLLLNLAVGGAVSHPPSASVDFPREMLIDYVRVYLPAHAPMKA